jgi:hypothetical protein
VKSQRSPLSTTVLIVLFLVFMAGIAASVASGQVLHGAPKQLAFYSGIAVSLVTSTILIRQQRVTAFLSSRPTLWFLFLFNGVVAVVCYFALDGVTRIAVTAVMGLVSLGAGAGLLRSPKTKPTPA